MTIKLIVAILLLCVASCATSFSVKEVAAPSKEAMDKTEPVDGIMINRRASYEMRAESTFLGKTSDKLAAKDLLNGVDQDKMLTVNICRYPFASGKLSTTLGTTQAIEKFGVTSQTGVAGLVEAADQSLATKTALSATPTPTPAPE